MTSTRDFLDQILVKIAAIHDQNGRTCLVFDLDSTLFDVSPRIQQILRDFANDPHHQNLFPSEVKFFPEIKTEPTDWGFKNALVRSGLTEASTDFQEAVKNFWKQHFFSNHYLEYDIPYDGAVDFLQKVAAVGSDIFYLTGRDVHRMGEGSRHVLRRWNFPLDEVQSKLVLKPNKEMNDGSFKRDWFLDIPSKKYQKIWFFENEPVNVNLVHQALPEVEIVFFDSTHAGLEQSPDHLTKIKNFSMNIDPKKKNK